LGAAFYWALTFALYRVDVDLQHDNALMYEERMRAIMLPKTMQRIKGSMSFPNVEKALPECIAKDAETRISADWKATRPRSLRRYRTQWQIQFLV